MQQKIEKWLLDKKTYQEKQPFQYFYLEWNNTEPIVSWEIEMPKIITFKKIIKWRIEKNYSIDITVCCNQTNKKKFKPNIENLTNFKTTFLKSHLQKCIRRKIKNKSIKTAYTLICKNFNEFIRRISIIMLEDCHLHYSFSYLIWIMVAYPEYQLTEDDINYLLKIIENLVSIEYKDPPQKKEYSMFKNISQINKLNSKFMSLIYSIGLRRSFGGMNGDMQVLSYFIEKWCYRFKNGKNLNSEVFRKINLNKKFILNDKLFLRDNINYSAIDFHCFPGILSYLNVVYPEGDEDLFKKLIWDNISSINLRKDIDDDLKIIAKQEKIKYDIELWDKYKEGINRTIIKFKENIYDS